MKEFMFYIRNAKDAKEQLSKADHLSFVKKCEIYIGKLQEQGQLVSAQPLIREGYILSRNNGEWQTKKMEADKQIQVGYYHILAKDIDEAISIAKENPEFEFVPSATIEIRPIKTKEEETGFSYPK